MAYISDGTSRLLVNSKMKNQENGLSSRYKEALNVPLPSKRSLSGHFAFYTELMKKTFGDMLIDITPFGRTIQTIAIIPCSSNDDKTKPYKALIIVYTYNLRSGLTTHNIVAVITTHVMRRLMQRKKDVRLQTLINEEFDLHTIGDILELLLGKYKGGDGKILKDGTEFKLQTTNGWVCGVVENTRAILKTWYP